MRASTNQEKLKQVLSLPLDCRDCLDETILSILHRITQGPIVSNLDYPDSVIDERRAPAFPHRRACVGGFTSLLRQGTSPPSPSH